MEAQRGAAQGYVTGDRGIWPGVCASGLAIYLVEPRVKWKCRVFCSKLLRIQDGKSRVLNQAWGPSKFPLPIEASPAVLRSWKARNSPPWVLSYHPLISPNCHDQAVDLSERVWRYYHPSTASNPAHRMCLWARLPGMWAAETYLCLYLMSTETLDIIIG